MWRLEGGLSAAPASAVSSARLPAVHGVRIEGAFLDHDLRAVFVEPSEKTAAVALMADARAGRIDAHQYRVGVAIHAHFTHVQGVPAQFALAPELASRAAVKSHRAARACRLIGFLVHEPQHKHLARPRVLNDRGNEPIELGKI